MSQPSPKPDLTEGSPHVLPVPWEQIVAQDQGDDVRPPLSPEDLEWLDAVLDEGSTDG